MNPLKILIWLKVLSWYRPERPTLAMGDTTPNDRELAEAISARRAYILATG